MDVDYNDRGLRAQPWLSKSATERETGGAMAKQLGALVAINGGYFDMMRHPARTFNLVLWDEKHVFAMIIQGNNGACRPYSDVFSRHCFSS